MFLEIMREMKEPRHFPRAVLSANGAMMLVYLVTSIAGYSARGQAIDGFLPDVLERGAVKAFVGILLTFHVAVAYLITGQPLHRAYHTFLFPHTVDKSSRLAACHWLIVTSLQLVFGFIVANAIPTFADFQNLLGTLTGGWQMAGFAPCATQRTRYALAPHSSSRSCH